MNWLSRFFRKSKQDAQLDSELRFHVEQQTADYIAAGVSPDEARRRALAQFGGLEYIKEETRDARGTQFVESLLQDVRFALRMLAKNRGATTVAVLSLAIAIGPNVVLFTVVNRLLLAPPTIPLSDATHLFTLYFKTDKPGVYGLPSYQDLKDLQAGAGDIASFIGSQNTGGLLDRRGQQEPVLTKTVTENYFSVLGLKAAAGRTLEESDARVVSQPPVVISDSLAQREYGRAANAVGQTMILSGNAYSVVGVMSKGFGEGLIPRDVWIPIHAAPAWTRTRGNTIDTVVRLDSGVSQAQAEAVLTTVARRLAKEYPVTDNWTSAVLTTGTGALGLIGDASLLLAGLVVLVACANIIGILLAQGEGRRHEFAMRSAMGATRGRLVRQLVAESMVLSVLGAGVGLLFALWLLPAASSFKPIPFFSFHYEFRLDGHTLAYTFLLTLVATVTTGLLPALRLSPMDLATGLKSNAPMAGLRSRFRGGLVIAQIAFSTFFLFGAGLLLRSLLQSQNMRPGFNPVRRVLWVNVVAPPGVEDIAPTQLADKLRALPGVRDVSTPGPVPPFLEGSRGVESRVSVPGVAAQPLQVPSRVVGPRYFRIMGTPLLCGREFQPLDSSSAAVVNETLAHNFWGNADAALGKILLVDGKERRIIGVAENGKYRSLSEEPMPYLFLSTAPPVRGGAAEFLVETSIAPEAVAGTVRKTIQQAAPGAFISNLVTLRQLMRFALLPQLLAAAFVGVLALLGMFLAGVGLYGLVAHSVGRRTQEIGLRMALGAGKSDIVSLVLRETLSRVGIGAAIGVGSALAAARLATTALYHVSPSDPASLTGAVVFAAALGLLAAYVPARRAMKVDPMVALRHE